MNNVTLYGHFAKVSASTNCDVTVTEEFEWYHGDGYYSATFVTVDDAWIEVRIKTSSFEEFEKTSLEHCPYCRIEGRLRTEVGRGTGIVKNYVWIE